MINPGILRTCVDNATMTVVGAVVVMLTGCEASPTVDVDLGSPVDCLIDRTTNEPHSLRRIVQTDEEQADRIRVAYTWTNDCPLAISLYNISVHIRDNPDRTGDIVGHAYIDDVNVGPNADAEVESVVRLAEGCRGTDIEGLNNVEMNFNIRYADQQ